MAATARSDSDFAEAEHATLLRIYRDLVRGDGDPVEVASLTEDVKDVGFQVTLYLGASRSTDTAHVVFKVETHLMRLKPAVCCEYLAGVAASNAHSRMTTGPPADPCQIQLKSNTHHVGLVAKVHLEERT